MDIGFGDVLDFVASAAVLVVVFAVLGLVFSALDRRLKAWVARPRKPPR
jgi:hypothetical protein